MARGFAFRAFSPSSLWREPDFRRLWTGQTISQFGSQITRLALPLTAVLTLKASPLQMGYLGAAQGTPFLLFGLVAGVLIDRRRRRPILITADAGRALALSSIPVAALLGWLRIEQVYVVGFAVGVLTLAFDVAYQSYLPSLVAQSQLVEGNSKLEASAAVAQIGGPGLGGALVGLVTAPLAISADALSFLASVSYLLRIRTSEPAPPEGPERQSIRSALAEGLAYVARHPLLRPLVVTATLANLGDSLRTPVFVLFMARVLGLGPGQIGLVFAGGSLGALLGASLASRLIARYRLGSVLIGGELVGVLGMALIPLVSGPTMVALPILALAWSLESVATTLAHVNHVSLRQGIVPDRLQGRVNATVRFATWGVIPIANVAGGALGATVGLRPTLAIGAAFGLLGFCWLVGSPVRGLRTFPAPPDPVAAERAGRRPGPRPG